MITYLPRFRALGTGVWALGIFLAGTLFSRAGELPADALAFLNTLPEGKVTLDLVIQSALTSSDSFKAIMADAPSTRVPELQSKIPLESSLGFHAARTLDRKEPQNPFMPNELNATSLSLDYTTAFQTGTGLQTSLVHSRSNIGFDLSPGLSFFETQATAIVSQSLWRNAFGKATRLGLEAGRLQSEAAELQLQENVEDFVLGLVGLFYEAWLMQQQADAASKSLERRKRLLEITRIKLRRGTSERPDLLQVKSAYLGNQAQEADALQKLGEIWRALVTTLKLPSEWIRIDPRQVPMKIDEPLEEALKACGETTLNPSPEETLQTRRLSLQARAANRLFEQAKSSAAPDLKLNLALASNGIDPISRRTWNETLAVDHPAWSLSLDLTIALSNHQARASLLTSLTALDRTEALYSKAKSEKPAEWINRCMDLKRWLDTVKLFEEAFEDQKQRLLLEERRFGIGRVPTLNIIQAGDDAMRAELDLRNAQVMSRLAAWRIRKLKSEIKPYIEALQKKDHRHE